MTEEIDIVSHIETLLNEKLWGQATSELAKLQPADIAEILSRYDVETQILLFNDLPDDVKPDVLADLSPEFVEAISEALPSAEVSDIVDEMDPDDAADVLGGLDKETSSQIIEQMDDEAADEVRRLMTYPEDSAGGIMTTDLITMKQNQTVLEALDTIASNEDGEHVYQIYVIDDEDKLVGIVSIWKLLHQRNRMTILSDIMEVETFAVRTDMDQEEVAHAMSKYDLSVIPVVDASG
ncbi:MAG: magnesium transporter, partial [Kiritimatiellae bacterium]|nr:magnesium transporter [Kiritimatiellia bacterium]